MHSATQVIGPAPHIFTEADAQMEGAIARNYSLVLSDCPYPHGHPWRSAWMKGYNRVDRQIASAMPIMSLQNWDSFA